MTNLIILTNNLEAIFYPLGRNGLITVYQCCKVLKDSIWMSLAFTVKVKSMKFETVNKFAARAFKNAAEPSLSAPWQILNDIVEAFAIVYYSWSICDDIYM